MLRRLLPVALSFFAAAFACAQDMPASRLDLVQKNGKLRVCTPGDYKPFSLQRADGGFEGLDVDLVQMASKSLGVEAEFVKSAWPTLMKDFVEKCDVGLGGISVTLD
ncbi:MAG: transporter substrate-binding domain-containing protein, partial [Caldimonas sp.]